MTMTGNTQRQCLAGTIVLAIYRPDPELLARQLQSIREQEVSDWVCLIGIDGHDLETASATQDLIADDKRFKVFHFPDNVGFYRNFERLLALVDAGSAWVALADQDDAWDRTKLGILTTALANRNVHLAMCQARIIDEAGIAMGRTHRRQVSLATLILNNQCTGSLAVFSPAVLRVALPFPEPMPSSYHDHWLGVVASALGGYVVVDEVLQSYVQHAGNVIGEERGSDLGVRFRRLVSDGPSMALHRLADERWGWRQRMARELIQRQPAAASDEVVRAIAAGALSRAVVRELVKATRIGAIGPARAGALAFGAALVRQDERSPLTR